MSGELREQGPGGMLRFDDPEHVDAMMFLVLEAELLDAGDLAGWLELVAQEVSYDMPVRTSRLREDPGTEGPGSFHFKESRASLELRVTRLLESPSVWSENPAPLVRRFVSNVRTRRADAGDLSVSSYLLLLRSRHDRERQDLISAERRDLLGRRADGCLELRSREITIDQTRLGLGFLPVPL